MPSYEKERKYIVLFYVLLNSLDVHSFTHSTDSISSRFSPGIKSPWRLNSISFVPKQTTCRSSGISSISLTMSKEGYDIRNDSDNDDLKFVKATDGEALQALFEKQCDQDGLMTKKSLVSIPMIADLLGVGDLLQEELDDIWEATPKFPDLESSSPSRIDVDSFIEIYRDIDDIFEDDGNDVEDTTDVKSEDKSATKIEKGEENEVHDGKNNIDNEGIETSADEKELKITFYAICNAKGFVSKTDLLKWSEVQELLDENMLDESEFNEIWAKSVKTSSESSELDFDGFVSFNNELDELFVIDDDDDNDDDDVANNETNSKEETQLQMFYGDDLPAGVIFSELADDDFLIGMNELKKWGDLQDMLSEGELLPIELENMFEQIPKASGTKNKLNEEGFESLYEAIDVLFEEEDETASTSQNSDARVPAPRNVKSDLLEAVSLFGRDENKMACGLESTESEVNSILNIVAELESQSSNLVLSSGGDITPSEVAGDWDLLYSTSSTMKFNKGLSGLVPPNGKFGGLKQRLKASKYLADIEYVEQINAGPASFEVKITGDWELRNSVSLFTGSRSVALSVEPDKVSYGLTSQRADHWKSLGPMNLLDIAYLDSDLRIMRGTTSTDSIFIFKRRNS